MSNYPVTYRRRSVARRGSQPARAPSQAANDNNNLAILQDVIRENLSKERLYDAAIWAAARIPPTAPLRHPVPGLGGILLMPFLPWWSSTPPYAAGFDFSSGVWKLNRDCPQNSRDLYCVAYRSSGSGGTQCLTGQSIACGLSPSSLSWSNVKTAIIAGYDALDPLVHKAVRQVWVTTSTAGQATKTIPARQPLEYPVPMPGSVVNPLHRTIPIYEPVPVPYPMIPRLPAFAQPVPGLQVSARGPRTSRAGNPRETRVYTIDANGATKSSPGNKHKKRRPRKREKERKFRLKGPLAGLWNAVGVVTEALDIFDAAYDAIPYKCKRRHLRRGMDYGDKVAILAICASSIDGDKFVRNVINNQIEDFFYALPSKGLKPLYNSGRWTSPVGVEAGDALDGGGRIYDEINRRREKERKSNEGG